MLTGRAAFGGQDGGRLRRPDARRRARLGGAAQELPVGLRHVLRLCLAKDLKQRLHHIGDVRIELEDRTHDEAIAESRRVEAAAEVAVAPGGGAAYPGWCRSLALIGAWLFLRSRQPSRHRARHQWRGSGSSLPEGERLAHCYRQAVDVSPDGRADRVRLRHAGRERVLGLPDPAWRSGCGISIGPRGLGARARRRGIGAQPVVLARTESGSPSSAWRPMIG